MIIILGPQGGQARQYLIGYKGKHLFTELGIIDSAITIRIRGDRNCTEPAFAFAVAGDESRFSPRMNKTAAMRYRNPASVAFIGRLV